MCLFLLLQEGNGGVSLVQCKTLQTAGGTVVVLPTSWPQCDVLIVGIRWT